MTVLIDIFSTVCQPGIAYLLSCHIRHLKIASVGVYLFFILKDGILYSPDSHLTWTCF